jgi:hypothetical protein
MGYFMGKNDVVQNISYFNISRLLMSYQTWKERFKMQINDFRNDFIKNIAKGDGAEFIRIG